MEETNPRTWKEVRCDRSILIISEYCKFRLVQQVHILSRLAMFNRYTAAQRCLAQRPGIHLHCGLHLNLAAFEASLKKLWKEHCIKIFFKSFGRRGAARAQHISIQTCNAMMSNIEPLWPAACWITPLLIPYDGEADKFPRKPRSKYFLVFH